MRDEYDDALRDLQTAKGLLRETSDWLSGSQDYVAARWERSDKKVPLGVRYVQGKVRDVVARTRTFLTEMSGGPREQNVCGVRGLAADDTCPASGEMHRESRDTLASSDTAKEDAQR